MIKAYLNDSISEEGFWQVEIYEEINGEPADESEFETHQYRGAAIARVEEINKAQPKTWDDLPERGIR